MKATSTTPPMQTTDRAGSPLAKVVAAPVFGSTRQMLPASGAVTNNAPPGPTALPELLQARDQQGRVRAPDGGVTLAADGANIAIKAADNTGSLRMKPMDSPFSTWRASCLNAGSTQEGRLNAITQPTRRIQTPP